MASLLPYIRGGAANDDAGGNSEMCGVPGAPAFVLGVDYDGTSDFFQRGSDLASNADGNLGILSVWFRIDGGNGAIRHVWSNFDAAFSMGNRSAIAITPANQLAVSLNDATTPNALNVLTGHTGTVFLAGAAWRHVLFSWDIGNQIFHSYVDNALDTPSTLSFPNPGPADYTRSEHGIGVGVTGNIEPWNGCMAELYINFGEFLDFSVEANRLKFISASGKPVILGKDGEAPTGSQPIMYFPNGVASYNRGFGGNFNSFGGVVNCSSSPSD